MGRELLLELARLLLTRSEEPRLGRILDTTDLHILVSLNPDGFEKIKSAGAWVDCKMSLESMAALMPIT